VGGDPLLFDASGNRLATPLIRQKPDFVGPDGVNTTFFAGSPQGAFGSGIAGCSNDTSFPSFFGTSAATPHVAAAAALMLQANPAVTPAQIRAALQSTASAMVAFPPDFSTGYGFVRVDEALAQLPPAAPAISVTPSSVTVGMSSVLIWNAVNVTACTASGDWSGSQQTSGTQTITPTAAGTLTYTLTCSNAPHGAAQNSVKLTVQAASSGGASGGTSGGGGGGGALDLATLLVISALALARLSSRRRRPT
jgi:subtilisin family serine protease